MSKKKQQKSSPKKQSLRIFKVIKAVSKIVGKINRLIFYLKELFESMAELMEKVN